MEFETAEITLIGDREENQDAHCVLISDENVLLAVCDGMGGHEDGALAAETAINTFVAQFKDDKPLAPNAGPFIQQVFLKAHAAVVRVGLSKSLDQRPRTTATLCIISGGKAMWGHIGDSRIYHLRNGGVFHRSRDHSAVETLFRRGTITEAEMLKHPMRNLVEECMGGEPDEPKMDITDLQELEDGDVLLLCSDGFWSPLNMDEVARQLADTDDLQEALEALAEQAAAKAAPHSDNVTATAIRIDSLEES